MTIHSKSTKVKQDDSSEETIDSLFPLIFSSDLHIQSSILHTFNGNGAIHSCKNANIIKINAVPTKIRSMSWNHL